MPDDLHTLTASEAADLLRQRQVSSVELTRSAFERIGQVEDKLHAFITLTEEEAMAQAQRADEMLARGEGGAADGDSGCDQGRHEHQGHS